MSKPSLKPKTARFQPSSGSLAPCCLRLVLRLRRLLAWPAPAQRRTKRSEQEQAGGRRRRLFRGSCFLPWVSPLSAALLKIICPIRFSSTTADWVWRITSPAASSFSSGAGLEADVLVTEQARGQDLGRRIFREAHAIVDLHRHDALVRLGVERDALDTPDGDTRAAHRRTRLQATDVVELGADGVTLVLAEAGQIRRLEREEQRGPPGRAGRTARPSFRYLFCSSQFSRSGHGVENINAVSMKSIASTDSDETTTVRVVA